LENLSVLRDVYPLLILEWRFKAYLLMAHRFIKERWRVSLLGFLILWARSQVAIHHLVYHIDLSSARFFPIPSINSYLVG